ncbi:MAG: mechanosensitive ion channel domain-containing protein [Solirubrobacteraceae bacterium]
MFETRSDAWEAVGLALEESHENAGGAQRRSLGLIALIIGVLVVWGERHRILGEHVLRHNRDGSPVYAPSGWETPLQIVAVILFIVLGLALARQAGRALGPPLKKRMEPGVAGTVMFLIRLGTAFFTVLIALSLAGVNAQSLTIGASFTAVIFGLAAQQTLGNLIAGMVLLTARPFRVGERVRFQAGALGGGAEGIVSSLGLLYTTLRIGTEDEMKIPNNLVLAAAVVPLAASVDVRVRLPGSMRPSDLQTLLDERVTTPTRGGRTTVLLEQLDGDELVVRVQATPENPQDGAQLADEIISVLSGVRSNRSPESDGGEPTLIRGATRDRD